MFYEVVILMQRNGITYAKTLFALVSLAIGRNGLILAKWTRWNILPIVAEIRATVGDRRYRIRETRIFGKSLIATRSCFIESRSRKVTVSRRLASFSPSVSKSTVTPNGVPISS